MGGRSSSSSSTTTDNSTKITTTTTTKVGGDIGLTGKAAVDLANVISGGATVVARDALARNESVIGNAVAANERVATLAVNEVGKAYSRFVGGSEIFTKAAENIAAEAQNTAQDALSVAESTIRSGQNVDKSTGQIIAENAPWIAAAVAAGAAIYSLRGK